MFLLVPAYPGCPGQTAVKWLLLLLLLVYTGGSTDTTITLFDIGIPQGDKYKTDIRLFLLL